MPSYKYQHSEVFAMLKAINENIKINLTSLEYLQILDYFLKNAWKPVVLNYPEFVNNYLSKVLVFTAVHRSFKVCSEPRKLLPTLIYKCILAKGKAKVTAFDRIHLNRGVIFGLLSQYINIAELRAEVWSPFNTKLSEREKFIKSAYYDSLLGSEDQDIFQDVFTRVQYWHAKAKSFRAMICQKYIRFALLQAQKAYVHYNYRVSLNDISVIYCMTVGKAVDRCDTRFGVLTSFIQNWMKSAQCQVIKLVNQENHLSLEALHEQYGDSIDMPTKELETNEDIEDIAFRAKQADPDGVLRATLKIPEYLNFEDQQLLEGLAV